jgi:hypothetical protein
MDRYRKAIQSALRSAGTPAEAFDNWSIPYEAVLERVLHNWNPYETEYEADVLMFSRKYHPRRD